MEQNEVQRTPEQVITDEWERAIGPKIAPEQQSAAEYFLDETLRAYSEDGRYYHTLVHVADCITKLASYQDREDYAELFLALLWHDVVYDTRSGTNEEDSAMLAGEMMDVLKLDGSDTVSRLILATKSHMAEKEDEALICGIDLSILGGSQEQYDAYREGIYNEYAWVEPGYFRTKRREVLESLQASGLMFVHPDFVHLNEPALHNMQQEILQLAA
jgi:predicted metal-dependent HD superfamily phosphohydrolase